VSAARLRRWRRRFGIAAPRVMVRTQWPWYLRWLLLGMLLAASAALAMWIYDAGRRFAGFDRDETQLELAALQRKLKSAQDELGRLRAIANASESKIAMERAAQQDLTRQVRGLGADNARLREELAVFESTLSVDPAKAPPLSIKRFRVEPELRPGEYRYHLLLMALGARRDDYRGRFELTVSLTKDGRDAMITLPRANTSEAQEFSLSFKHFQRVQGTFRVDPAARVNSVQLRVYENGVSQERATQTAQVG
jgi:hypothetical protein